MVPDAPPKLDLPLSERELCEEESAKLSGPGFRIRRGSLADASLHEVQRMLIRVLWYFSLGWLGFTAALSLVLWLLVYLLTEVVG